MLEAVPLAAAAAGEETRHAIRHLFLFIGAEPNTVAVANAAWRSTARASSSPAGSRRTGMPLETSR